MLTLKRSRPTLAFVAASALSLLATGCSATRSQSALGSLRGITLCAHPTTFAVATTRHAVAVQRHAREHALASVHAIANLHHRSARSL